MRIENVVKAWNWLSSAYAITKTLAWKERQPAWIRLAGKFTGRAILALLGKPQPSAI